MNLDKLRQLAFPLVWAGAAGITFGFGPHLGWGYLLVVAASAAGWLLGSAMTRLLAGRLPSNGKAYRERLDLIQLTGLAVSAVAAVSYLLFLAVGPRIETPWLAAGYTLFVLAATSVLQMGLHAGKLRNDAEQAAKRQPKQADPAPAATAPSEPPPTP